MKITSKYTLDVKGEGESSGMEFKADFPGLGQEVIYFDHKNGMLLEVIGSASIAGKINFEEDEVEASTDQKFEDHVTVVRI